MKTHTALVLAIVIGTAAFPSLHAQADRQPAARGSLAQIGWLAGVWVGGEAPLTFEERWTPAAGGAMLAVSRTIKGERMIAFEFLRIIERDGGLVYVAQPNGQPPTEFELTALTPESMTFENPAHDFPKMIRYTKRPDGTLEARVSDGGPTGESVLFRRQP